MKLRPNFLRHQTALAALATLITVPTLRAASGAWNVDAAGNWSTATNWTPAVVPGTAAGDVVDLTFNITAARTITIDTTSRTVGDLNIGDPTATLFGYTLASSAGTVVLNLDGAGTADATVDFLTGVSNTISAPITLIDNGIFRSNVGFAQTLSGVISGTGKTVTFNNDTNGVVNAASAGNGQFLVTGANTYTGGTTISDVRVNITTNNTALGAAGSAVNILNGGQVFASTGLATINYAFNIAGNGWAESTTGQPFGALRLEGGAIVTGPVAMTANAGIGGNGTGTVNGVISGGFTLTKRGSGTIILGGANIYSGGTNVAGILQLNNNSAAGSGAINLIDTRATASGGDNSLFATRVLVNGGVTIGNTFNLGNTTGTAGFGVIQQTGTGLATVSGPINITGAPTSGGHFVGGTVAANTLVLNGAINSSVVVTQREGFVRYGGGGTGYNALLITNTAQVGATNGISTATVLSLGGSGTGILDLNGFDQSLAGLIFGQAINANTGIVNLGAKTLTLTGDISTITGAFNAPHTINGTAGGTLNVGASPRSIVLNDSTAADDLTINGATVLGAGGLIKTGAGTLTLNGATFSAPLTVNTGTLAIGTFGAAGSATVNSLTFGGGTTLRMKAGGDLLNVGTLVNNGTTTVSLNQLGGILPNGTFNLIHYTGSSPGLAGFSLSPVGHSTSALVDTGSAIALQVTGNDRVVWDGTNSNTWATGATGNWKLATPLTPTDYIESDDVIFRDGPTNSSVVLPANVSPSNVSFANSTATTYTLSGAGGITGATALTKTGNGTVVLVTSNNYTGPTIVAEGTLELDHDAPGNQVLTGTSGVSVAPGATLRITRDGTATAAATTFSRDLTGAGTVDVNLRTGAVGTVADSLLLTGTNTGFTGTLRLLSPTTGTYRLQQPTAVQLGEGGIVVQSGAQLYTAANQTYNNSINIAGTGFADSAGNIGALRLEPGSVWAGPVVVNGAARIGAHNGTATVIGDISGGDLTVNATNFNNSYTLVFAGDNSYGQTIIGGQNTQTAGTPSMRLNIGSGSTTGTLGAGNVIINGDGANGVLGFDRSDGYTLATGQTITGATGSGTIANSIQRTFIEFDTLGAGFSDNGNTITLGTAALGGNIRVAQSRAGAIANISGALTAQTVRLSTGQAGGVLNLNSGANVAAGIVALGTGGSGSVLNVAPGATLGITSSFHFGEAANNSATGNQTGGDVTFGTQMRVGHFSTETSTYTISGGTLTATAGAGTFPFTTGATEQNGGIYLGIDGTGSLVQTGGVVSTNFIVLDNRTETVAGANMLTGNDTYALSGGTLILKSAQGIISRFNSTALNLNGGTIQAAAGISPNLDVLKANVGGTTTLDTNGANTFTLYGPLTGAGGLALTGGERSSPRTAPVRRPPRSVARVQATAARSAAWASTSAVGTRCAPIAPARMSGVERSVVRGLW